MSALFSGSDKKLVQSVGVVTFRLVISLRTGLKPLDLFFRVPSLTDIARYLSKTTWSRDRHNYLVSC